ncbi:MAG: hypothetical protein ABSB30_08150 [Terracidiphilus sp.]|jgi:hypothetical protein
MSAKRKIKTLRAFTDDEREKAHTLLAIRVAHMMGRKLEEGDWAEVYCRAKGIPIKGWSNLDIDIMNGRLGVEHKMIRYSSKGDISEACGTSIMHPSATRAFRVPPTTTDANNAMYDVLTQYGDLIRGRSEKVRELSGSEDEPDMRTGWLLWQDSLRQFLYFEEEMAPPDPRRFEAKWVQRVSKSGSRKPSTNLWIYDRKTGAKRYSVTTEAGAKIQPYFDVPPLTDPNVYIFTVIGEILKTGFVKVWLTDATARELERVIGSLNPETLSRVVLESAKLVAKRDVAEELAREVAHPFTITLEAYQVLQNAFPGVSDEHCFQRLAEQLRSRSVG